MSLSSILAILAFIGPSPATAEEPADPPVAPAATTGTATGSPGRALEAKAAAAPGAAPDATPDAGAGAGTDAATDGDDEEKRLKAQFKNLRFQENWTALADQEMQTDHWYPGLKYVELGEQGDWSASFGGQARWQTKWDENRLGPGGSATGSNDYNLLRLRLHGDLRLRDDFRAYVELIHATTHGNEVPPAPIDRNSLDVLNAFVEFYGDGTSTRIGRTEMEYGAQRLISPLDWGNTRRAFQGGVFQVVNGELTTDVFAVKPVAVDPRGEDDPDHSRWFAGAYSTYALGPGTGVDAYLLLLNEDDDVIPTPGAATGNMELYTYGARYWAKAGATDWEAEAARQSGDFGGNAIRASMLTLRAGQTFDDCPGKPRVGLDFDYASGDEDSTDTTHGTFNQLYPLGHAYFGYLDLVGRQNIIQIMPNVVWQTSETTSFRVSYSDFELADDDDFLYNAGGGASSPGAALGTSRDVGHEVDLTLTWRPPCMAPHGAFLFGYSEFDPGTFTEGYGADEHARLTYVQYTFTF
jgi:hypothetical protein